MSRWLITNARLVNEGETTETDVRIERGRIDRIDGELSARPRETVVDARGRYLLPGMIDSQVHFREPGLTRKGSIASESRAAVAGGITSFMDLPDTLPATNSRHALADKFSRAHGRATANYSFYLGAEPGNLEEIRAATHADACGLVIRIGGATRNGVISDFEMLAQVVEASELLPCLYGEDGTMVEANRGRLLNEHGGELSPAMHAEIHSPESSRAAVDFAARLVERTGRDVHTAGLSSAAELDRTRADPLTDKRLSTAVSLPQLYFIDADHESLSNLIKDEPPVRDSENRRALRRALGDGRIDLIATGHAPQLLRDKGPNYSAATTGMPVVQFALPVAWSLVASRMLSPASLVEKTAHNPALRFGLAERGFVREGYWADLTLIDEKKRCLVDKQPNLSHCGWTPFAGRKLPASVAATWVNGALVWREGLLTGQVPGQRLAIRKE